MVLHITSFVISEVPQASLDQGKIRSFEAGNFRWLRLWKGFCCPQEIQLKTRKEEKLLLRVSIIGACRRRVRGWEFTHAAQLQTSHNIRWVLEQIQPPAALGGEFMGSTEIDEVLGER